MDKKYLVLNYLDCNETYKNIIHNEIYHIGLDYLDPVIKMFSDSKPGCLPQFVFLFLNSQRGLNPLGSRKAIIFVAVITMQE